MGHNTGWNQTQVVFSVKISYWGN